MPTRQPDTKPELRQRREALGLSREKLARQADCAAITIEMLEGGWAGRNSHASSRRCSQPLIDSKPKNTTAPLRARPP